jgi:hypothetical protein
MKKGIFILMLLGGTLVSTEGAAQVAADTTQTNQPKIYLLTKNDGTEFLGEILSQDAREYLMRTEKIGDVYIPKHEVKSVKEVNPKYYKEFEKEELFATRYFITTNGLPIKKGDNYIQWNIYGPDFQFGVADNLGVGVMTSWAAIPVIANMKYSIPLDEKNNIALGLLAGTGSWALPEFGLVLPFASYTIGDRKNNINFSLGYGSIFYQESVYNPTTGYYDKTNRKEGRVLFSVAGMAKINSKFSLVFDTFVVPKGPYQTKTTWDYNETWDETLQQYTYNYVQKTERKRSPNIALILPGIRWQMDPDKAFQFGFSGLNYSNQFVPMPIPMVQWYRKL